MTSPHGRPRVAVVTLGCAKNTADTDLLAGQLLAEGWAITPEPSKADMILILTCAFLTSAQQESIDLILEMAEHRRGREDRRLVVLGCLAQRHGAALLDEIPEIDLLVGPGEVHRLAPRLRALLEERGGNGERVRLGGMDSVEERWDLRVISRHRHSAYVKISEGCDRTCSFCIIPRLRGGHRSRSIESIVHEVARLGDAGVREVNLVAQELTAYGIDLYGRPALADLLVHLNRIDSIDWIRLLYTYPSNWSDELIGSIRDLTRVVAYVDIPIQHVSEPILRRMRRPQFRTTRRLLDRIRAEIPGVVVRSTLITGFPGETEEEFLELLGFVGEYSFDLLGVFSFSPEEGTDACDLADPIPASIRQERRATILAAQQEVSLRRNRSRIGQTLTLLVDSLVGPGTRICRHPGQAPEVDGVTHLLDAGVASLQPGSLVEAVITRAEAYDLEARPAKKREIG